MEFKKPSFTVSPLWQVPEDEAPLLPELLDESLEPQAEANSASELTVAITMSDRNRVVPNIKELLSGPHEHVRGPGTYGAPMSPRGQRRFLGTTSTLTEYDSYLHGT
ncbi:hypothetical protein [Aquihabitans sp. McL0605]|uniref:hypothetical protein n=1 Tax=Aquihabitans sp. McL0605 TaxID=3415671 RepID=UPI003CF97678